MARGPRLDAPGALHHVMVRGLECRAIFRDDGDRAEFVRRLAALAAGGALAISAWALLPNPAHLLVRTGARPLARSLRSLLNGYAGAFNRRHRRIGLLVQNRSTSSVVEAAPYRLGLARGPAGSPAAPTRPTAATAGRAGVAASSRASRRSSASPPRR
jgi:hypothetical protein